MGFLKYGSLYDFSIWGTVIKATSHLGSCFVIDLSALFLGSIRQKVGALTDKGLSTGILVAPMTDSVETSGAPKALGTLNPKP